MLQNLTNPLIETNIPRSGLVHSSYIHVSVSDFYIHALGLLILLQENRSTDPWNIEIAHRYKTVEIRTEAEQFLFGEYTKRIFFAVHHTLSFTV